MAQVEFNYYYIQDNIVRNDCLVTEDAPAATLVRGNVAHLSG